MRLTDDGRLVPTPGDVFVILARDPASQRVTVVGPYTGAQIERVKRDAWTWRADVRTLACRVMSPQEFEEALELEPFERDEALFGYSANMAKRNGPLVEELIPEPHGPFRLRPGQADEREEHEPIENREQG